MKEKLKLSFVNNGKEFEIPKMTVKKQELVMEEVAKQNKESMNTEKYNALLGKLMLLNSLKEVDPNVTLEDVEGLHPDDFALLFSKFWNSGRELTGGDNENFRTPKKKYTQVND